MCEVVRYDDDDDDDSITYNRLCMRDDIVASDDIINLDVVMSR
jgi:hypothetical protein